MGCFRKRFNLRVPNRMCERKAMQQYDRRSISVAERVQSNAVELNVHTALFMSRNVKTCMHTLVCCIKEATTLVFTDQRKDDCTE